MSTFPQPGELTAMAVEVAAPWTDICIILTYGESQDVDGAPLTVFSEGDEQPCVWAQVKVEEKPGAQYTTTINEWTLMLAPDVQVTRRDCVRLVARFGTRLLEPIVGAVWGDPIPEIGSQTIHVREVSQ